MKTHPNRPGLRAVEVRRWVQKGILSVRRVKLTPVFYLISGKTVRQTWLSRSRSHKGKIERKTATTYLRRGIFLVPRWRPVARWEINYLESRGMAMKSQGILFLESAYRQLTFMQVDDLDHAQRQQDHILENYLGVDFLRSHLPELMITLLAQEIIVDKTIKRNTGVESLQTNLEVTLHQLRISLKSILENALSKDELTPEKTRTIASYLRSVIRTCDQFPFRPVGRKLQYAVRSLTLAASHLKSGKRKLARERLKSALKNLEYTKPKGTS